MEKVMKILILLLVLTSTILIAQETKIELPTDDNTSSFTVTGTNADRRMKFFGNGGFYITSESAASTIPIDGSGERMMWYPGKVAFRAGYVSGDQWNEYNVGKYSFAAGCNTTASGISSIALGYGTTAKSFASLVIGQLNIAEGNLTNWVSTDPLFVCGNGYEKKLSNALTLLKNGNITLAGSVKSESGGFIFPDGTIQTTASGSGAAYWTLSNNSLYNTNSGLVGINESSPKAQLHIGGSEGLLVQGLIDSGTDLNLGAGTRLHWYPKKAALRVGSVDGLNWDADSMGINSVAFGFDSKAIGFISTATGNKTTASGENSTAMGKETTASGNNSTAFGQNTTASGGSSTAFGNGTTASADYASTAMGYQTEASGPASTAMGYKTTASGRFSTAVGYRTTAQALSSVAIGMNNYNAGTSDVWVGTDPIFEVGVGVDENNKANALTVLKNGNVGINIYNPEVELHVRDQWTNGDAEIRITAGAGDNARLSFYQSSNKKWVIQNHTTDGGLYIYDSDGSATVRLAQNASSWSSASDRRLKEKIKPMENILDKINGITPVTYYFKGKENKEIGLIAQEVAVNFPEIVSGTETDSTYLSLMYDRLGPVAIAAIKEQQKQIEQISIKYEQSSRENKELKDRVSKLEEIFEQLINEKNEMAKK